MSSVLLKPLAGGRTRLGLFCLASGLAAILGLAAGWALAVPAVVVAGTVAAIGFILGLIGLLWRGIDLPEPVPAGPRAAGFAAVLVLMLAGIALTFAVGVRLPPWLVMTAVLGLIAVPIIVRAWRQVTARLLIAVSVAGAACFVLSVADGELPVAYLVYLLFVSLAAVAGALLAGKTRIALVYSVDGRPGEALRSLAIGLVLALPSSLMNLTSGIQAGDDIRAAWEPLTAFVPGYVEEAVARLMLLSLAFSLLAGRRGGSGRTALVAAVLISAFTHAMSHLPATAFLTPAGGMMLVAGALFGVPMALVFVRFGFEAAVGYHFLVDFVRFLAAYFTG